eukprot:evm.model.scf_604.1 EVM.evm.TU.scf_604.1   scf_604:14432-16247(-)
MDRCQMGAMATKGGVEEGGRGNMANVVGTRKVPQATCISETPQDREAGVRSWIWQGLPGKGPCQRHKANFHRMPMGELVVWQGWPRGDADRKSGLLDFFRPAALLDVVFFICCYLLFLLHWEIHPMIRMEKNGVWRRVFESEGSTVWHLLPEQGSVRATDRSAWEEAAGRWAGLAGCFWSWTDWSIC